MKLLSIDKKYEGKYLTFYIATYLNKDGFKKEYEFVSRNHNLTVNSFGNTTPIGVGMIPFSKNKDKILLQQEYRLACNQWVYNFPAGLIDVNESIDKAATRELFEETGVKLEKVIDILPPSYASQGISDEAMYLVVCIASGDIKDSCFADEEIKASWIDKKQAKKLLDDKALMSSRTQMFLYQWINS